MATRYPWAPAGARTVAAMPCNTPPNTTTIAAMIAHGMGLAPIVRGGVDRIIFATYLEQVPGPTLRPGQILADKLSAHTGPEIGRIIAVPGCVLLAFAPYSPDYAPIELAFVKLKACLREVAAQPKAHSMTPLSLAHVTCFLQAIHV